MPLAKLWMKPRLGFRAGIIVFLLLLTLSAVTEFKYRLAVFTELSELPERRELRKLGQCLLKPLLLLEGLRKWAAALQSPQWSPSGLRLLQSRPLEGLEIQRLRGLYELRLRLLLFLLIALKGRKGSRWAVTSGLQEMVMLYGLAVTGIAGATLK